MFGGIGGTAGLYSRALQRLFNTIRGPMVVAPEFSAQVDLFGRPELWGLHGGELMMGLLDGLVAGGAGNRSQVAIVNPLGSKEIAIIEQIWFMHTAVEVLYHAISQTPLTNTTGNLVTRDTRRVTTTGGSMPSGVIIKTQNNAALANVASLVGKTITPANAMSIVFPDFVLGPGWSYRLYPTADNVAIASQITFIVRARPATDDEIIGL